MALFRWGFGRRRAADGPALDPSFGDEALAVMLRQAAAGDWAALRQGLAGVTDAAELTWVLSALADVRGVETWISRAVEAEPGSALPLLLSGARHVSWGWEARTRASARDVSREQWEVFHRRLAVAEEQLYEAAEREPDLLAPWYFLQISGRGTSLDREAATYRFEAALRRCPGHLDSHRQRLQQLCEKWGGSHEEMHAFADGAVRAAPEGSPLGELVALAHLERWLSLEGGAAGSAYLNTPAVREELHEAARRSVLHPDYPRPRGWKGALNTFALAFSLSGQPEAARLMFERIGTTVTERPWMHLSGDPAEAFRRHRDAAAAAAR
ncbi:hypothetical protein [Kitasatospora camelliae]|uniref:DUF4034 domain-containing protein n=1 Tax=Kitasatospora camelliae TaxID=3156397 RepID=A0AAU8JRR3_9ACTN